MNKIKLYLRKIIYTLPGAKSLWIWLIKFLGAEFSGWGMVTHTLTPWHNEGGDKVARDFLRTNREIVSKVKEGKFNLSQFNDVQDKTKLLNELMWRHYIVFWSARYASMSTKCSVKNLVECGVCDGLTMYFAMNALKEEYEFKSYLYDAWESMKSELLLESESWSVGDYSYLAIENTKNNLAAFKEETVFNKGFIPASFAASDNPTEIVWLHIDLNSSLPTTDALQFFFEKMPPGGIILFDDYAWGNYYDTKLAVDKFFSGKTGVLLPFPTGQAIYFKH
jgi:O-methyltransferase